MRKRRTEVEVGNAVVILDDDQPNLHREPQGAVGGSEVSGNRHALSPALREIKPPSQRALDAGTVEKSSQPVRKQAARKSNKHVDLGPLERYFSATSSLPKHRSSQRLGLADMSFARKLGSLLGFRHMDTLDREPGPPPQSVVPSSSRQGSPPAKKQKLGSEEAPAFTQAAFGPMSQVDGVLDASPRKNSTSSIYSTSEARGGAALSVHSSNKAKANQANVAEFRNVDRFLKQPPRKRQRRKNSNSSTRSPFFIEDDSEPDVQQSKQTSRANPSALSMDEVGRRFQQTSDHLATGSLPSNIQKRKAPADAMSNPDFKRPRRSSPDPLGQGHDGLASGVQKSRSLSRKGDITPTVFSSSSGRAPKGHNRGSKPEDEKDGDRAQKIIRSSGLRLKRGVSGSYAYPAPNDSINPVCSLRCEGISTLLLPMDQYGQELQDYTFLTINLSRVRLVRFSASPKNYIVSIERSLASGAPPKLHLEFESSADTDAFLKWVNMSRNESVTVESQIVDGVHLEKELLHLGSQATQGRVLRDSDDFMPETPDVQLIRRNRQRQLYEEQAGKQAAGLQVTLPSRQAKIKDSMQMAGESDQNHVPAVVSDITPSSSVVRRNDEPWTIPESPPQSSARRTRASTRTNIIRTPPPVRGWTEDNPGWEAEWTRSLVFPAEGKSRATVDRNDIQRLDKGQFLNDNLIIFYLRYLQYHLENDYPQLAKRVHFLNTFFYDKLKPTRSGAGINYDSVKGWTSKVDLFTKDFIIVPINEYSHWYVAIIYNAPKLLPSTPSKSKEASSNASHDLIEVGDNTLPDAGDGTSTDPNGSSNTGSSLAQENAVTENFNRMSISSSDSPGDKPLQPTVNDRQGVLRSIEGDATVNLVKDSDDANANTQDRPAQNPLSRNKSNKRSNTGPRKQDPNQAKIITLDSLGSTHSPVCTYLKHYLVAEGKDKKGLDIQVPRTLGMTAKDVPQQHNFCDCGLYLLGYICQLLRDPDKFVHSILQGEYEAIDWDLDPTKLRAKIRETIFDEQKEQQKRDDARKAEKRQAAIAKRNLSSRPSSSEGSSTEQQPGQDVREVEQKDPEGDRPDKEQKQSVYGKRNQSSRSASSEGSALKQLDINGSQKSEDMEIPSSRPKGNDRHVSSDGSRQSQPSRHSQGSRVATSTWSNLDKTRYNRTHEQQASTVNASSLVNLQLEKSIYGPATPMNRRKDAVPVNVNNQESSLDPELDDLELVPAIPLESSPFLQPLKSPPSHYVTPRKRGDTPQNPLQLDEERIPKIPRTDKEDGIRSREKPRRDKNAIDASSVQPTRVSSPLFTKNGSNPEGMKLKSAVEIPKSDSVVVDISD